MFNKIPFEVAKKLLEKPLICRDFGNWIASKKNSYIYEFECGLLDQDEMTCSLHVKFHYFYHPLTKVTSYTLSVFDKQLYGMERVYQLEVKKIKRKLKIYIPSRMSILGI